MYKKLVAEFLGTFVLVLGGVGTAIFAASAPTVGVGWLGVSLAFGLTVFTMAYAFGHISGGHFNPAVSLGLWSAGRFGPGELAPYIIAQVLGGVAASAVIWVVGIGQPLWNTAEKFASASNGYGVNSPGKYNLMSGAVIEVVMTFMFLLVIIGVTSAKAPKGFAPAAIGLSLALVHFVSIPVTNASVNPARSIATAVFAGGWAVAQLWAFIVFPLVGAVLAGLVYRYMLAGSDGS